MKSPNQYDIAITGGGLAGLALSIQLAGRGYNVALFEKEQYPFHKVCGEYISLESWDFLTSLGLQLENLNVSHIDKLQVSSVNGKMLEQVLPLGGFGISRYRLDNELATIARVAGVAVFENTKISEITFDGDQFSIEANQQIYNATIACGSFGKRSNLDVKWKRSFISAGKSKLNNYIGVKYHVRLDHPPGNIALHNFKNGYCGIVKIEDDKYNLCYLTTAGNLQQSDGSIGKMENTILSQNPFLKDIFIRAEKINELPVTISQISFDKKAQVEDHVLMIGDAAGMITPLCGNGMSMALHASKLAAESIHSFLQGDISRPQLEQQYSNSWRRQFARRLRAGRIIQRMLGSNRLTNILIGIARPFPSLINFLVRQTHGQPF